MYLSISASVINRMLGLTVAVSLSTAFPANSFGAEGNKLVAAIEQSCWQQRSRGRILWNCTKLALKNLGGAIVLDEALDAAKSTKGEKPERLNHKH